MNEDPPSCLVELLESPAYTQYYCEENIYHLCSQSLMQLPGWECFALFISNSNKAVPIWCQGLAAPENYVVWDYHVILLAHSLPAGTHGSNNTPCNSNSSSGSNSTGSWWVIDLDTRLPKPCSAKVYVASSFRPKIARRCHSFRVVRAQDMVNFFASDRSHMLDKEGRWNAPPPVYEPICGASADCSMNLEEWLDMTEGTGRGRVLDVEGLIAFIS
ncbi:unnamed protein product [Chrysoparadoxa australica]